MVTAATVSLTINAPYGTPNGIQVPVVSTLSSSVSSGNVVYNGTQNAWYGYDGTTNRQFLTNNTATILGNFQVGTTPNFLVNTSTGSITTTKNTLDDGSGNTTIYGNLSASNGNLQTDSFGDLLSQNNIIAANSFAIGSSFVVYANSAIGTSSGGSGSTRYYIGNAYINVTASARRFKKQIQMSKLNALEALEKVKVRDFYYKSGEWAERGKWTGLVAEEIKEIPELSFAVNPDAVEYHHLVGILIKAIQELDKKVQDLSAELALLT